jgi:thiosulfate dehydrogenase
MNNNKLNLAVMLVVSFALIGAGLVLIFSLFVNYGETKPISVEAPQPEPGTPQSSLVFAPPRPEEAPEDIRDAVMLGYNILLKTPQYAPQYVGDKLQCTNCHFDAGRAKKTLSLVGVAAKYPKYRTRSGYSTDLVTRTNGCFQRSMNGKPLPAASKEMQAIMAYYHWISKGLPIYEKIPWLGLTHLKTDYKGEKSKGQMVFAKQCQQCHGIQGEGTIIAPPLWGSGSFNDGAGMSKLENFAAFAHAFMPKNNPDLTVDQAMDVAAYVTSQPRPHFSEKQDPEDVW